MPGQPVALAHISGCPPGNSLSPITGCRWPYRNHPASSGNHVSVHPLSARIVLRRNTKKPGSCEEAVDDVTSLWKAEEN